MKVLSISAVAREQYGKKAAKAVRREGLVPCILCGAGQSIAFSLDAKEIKPLVYTPAAYIVELTIDGKKYQAVMREVQFHPIREQILHIEFYQIQETKPVAIAIPVRLDGSAEGVKVGGKLILSTRKVIVSAPVNSLPDEVVVDVTALGVGQTIFVGDLAIEGLKFLTPATTAICAVRVTRASRDTDDSTSASATTASGK
ncbi:MAG: 50S ribosomal protein L25 [Alistipes sp.]